MTPEDVKARQAAIWGSGCYEPIAAKLASMHDTLVRLLEPRAGERWLDVATGTGEVAARAASRGAEVTGIDFSAPLVETARRLARERGLEIAYDIGDAERLPYEDNSFDVVSSAVGVSFAQDHRAAAREIRRVCPPGGRLGLTAWRPEGGVGDFFRIMEPFQVHTNASVGSHFDWGREAYVGLLLGEAFELEFNERDCPYTADSGDDAWTELSSAYGPTKALAESLDKPRREELRRTIVEFYEQLRVEGGVRHSRTYLLVTGRRRGS